ncbi:MAG: hypothetical protein HC890_09645 [Chloroflexaceae bacterium]|nr:hypothetical protein [Chloroflexaceae bacterium]
MNLSALSLSFGEVILPQSNLSGEAATVEVTITNRRQGSFIGDLDLNLFSSVDDSRTSASDFLRDFLQTSQTISLDLDGKESTTITLNYDQVVNASPGAFHLIAELAEVGSDPLTEPGAIAEEILVSRPGTNVVIDWASAFLNATQVGQTLETAPPYQARNMGIVFPAIFDAVNLVESAQSSPQFESIFVDDLPQRFDPERASAEAAAIGAAFTTLTGIYEESLARLESVDDEAGIERIENVLQDLRQQRRSSLDELRQTERADGKSVRD